jgi:hypothetical protein
MENQHINLTSNEIETMLKGERAFGQNELLKDILGQLLKIDLLHTPKYEDEF